MIKKDIKEIIKKKKFTFSLEVVPPRNGTEINTILKQMYGLKKRIDFVSVTKGAGGSMRSGTLPLCHYIQEKCKIPAIAHYVCRERNRYEIENDLTDMYLFNIKNILALRGDKPAGSNERWKGEYKYAYLLAKQISEMNKGNYLPLINSKDRKKEGKKTDFTIFVAGHPEEDCKKEIAHLKEKIKSGGEIIITQMMFSYEDYEKYIKNLKKNKIKNKVIAGIRPIISYKQAMSIEKFFGMKIDRELKKKLKELEDDKKASKEYGINHFVNIIKKLKKVGYSGIHFFLLNDLELLDNVLKRL